MNKCQPRLVTQAPLAATIGDFWTMVWEKDVGVVVALNDVGGKEDSPCYWPKKNGAVVNYEPIKVEKIKSEKLEGKLRTTVGASIGSSTTMAKPPTTTKTQTHDLRLRKDDVTKTLKLYEFPGWREGEAVPDDPDAFLTLLAHHAMVQVWRV